MIRTRHVVAALLAFAFALPAAAASSECVPDVPEPIAVVAETVASVTPARLRPIVTIDGPSGAGKSTMARKIAAALGYVHVDSGAIFRAVTLAATRAGIAPGDARIPELLARIRVRLEQSPAGPKVFLDGEDVSAAIRTQELTVQVPSYAAIPAVFDFAQKLTRELAADGGAVLEGRSTGTATFPDAEVKFWLDAPLDVRAGRRHGDMVRAGESVTLDEVRDSMARRDHEDEIRVYGPLRRPAGAIEVSTESRSIEDTAALMVAEVRARELPVLSALAH